jgi:aspartate kinase
MEGGADALGVTAVPILVQKYGGSSVADLDKLRRVARKIVSHKRAGYDMVVVVSAMGDTTDDLLEMARQLAPNPSRRELDMLLSVGERISMALLSMAIQHEGLQAISLTGSQCGIITTDSHSNARIMDVRPFRVQDELDRGNIVIIAGYQGTSYKREVTTLGRGGSDTTAVALAAALSAEACEIYSDVDGVYSADPRVVLSAQQLATLSYDEMLEMARSGAKVLNEQAVEFARKAGIALYARSTHKEGSVGTIVRPDGAADRAKRLEAGLPAVAVSQSARVLWLTASQSADALMAHASGQEVICASWTPGAAASLCLNTENLHDEADWTALALALGEDVRVEPRGLVSVVGHGIGGSPRWALAGQELLRGADITPHATYIAMARLSWVVRAEQVAPAAVLLHAAFVEALPGRT